MYCWRFAQKPHNGATTTVELLVSRLKMRLGIVLTLITIVLFVGIVATWMLARKILEQWLLWIFANFFSAGLYFWCGLYPTAGLFVVYGILSIVGWYKWKKTLIIDN
jgi:nicotinamide riboside transporter PnuC